MGEMMKVREDERLDLQAAFSKFREKYIKASVPVEGVLKEENFEGKYPKNEILNDKQRVNNKKSEF